MSNLLSKMNDLRIYVPTFMEEHKIFLFHSYYQLWMSIEYGLQIQCTIYHLTSLRDKTTTTARLNRTHELLDNSRPTGLTYAACIRLSQKSSASHMWRRGEKRIREMELTSNDLEMECFRRPSPWLPSSVFSLSQGTQWSGLENLAASQ